MSGFVSIFFDKTSNSKPTTIIKKINDIDHVAFAHLVTGQVDAQAWVDAPDSDAFRDTILAINRVPGVASTVTNVAL